MTRTTVLSAVALVVLLALASSVHAEGTQTLHGEFVWAHRDNSGDLEAIFTPTGEGTWDVSFHFDMRGTPHTYTGTAEGSLTDGELKGTVKNEDGRRTFTFEGNTTEGEFSGTHAETTGGRAKSTGTLKLSG